MSDLGHEVLLYDIDPGRIAKLKEGHVPIYEPGLADLIHRNQRNGRLSFASEIPPAWGDADVYFIAVGTPPGPEGAADLSAVMAVAVARQAVRAILASMCCSTTQLNAAAAAATSQMPAAAGNTTPEN